MTPSPISPADAAVALRSFPRRFRQATALEPGENPERFHEQPGLLGTSVADLVTDAVRTLTLLDRALEGTLVTDTPALHPAVLERDQRDFTFAGHGAVEDVLAELDDVAVAFADRVERVPASAWTRAATLAGRQRSTTALELLGEAVDTVAGDLRDIETTMAQFRGR